MPHPYTYPENKHAWYVQFTYKTLKIILGPPLRLIFIKEVTGLNNIPEKGAVMLAFNHQSYFDFLCFIAICPRPVHFLSAEKFFSHMLWKPFMKWTGQIKVYRTAHDKHILHRTVYDHLKNGKTIGIFPEGTRAPDPHEMLHAFTGVVRYSIDSHVPVIPVGIKGAHEVMSRHDRFPKFKKVISFHIGEPIHFREHYDKNLSEMDYRDATDRVMVEIAKLSGKKYPHIGQIIRGTKPVVPAV